MKKFFLFSVFILIFVSAKAQTYPTNKNLSCLDIVLRLNPSVYYYDLTKDPTLPNTLQFGFLAQDLVKVIPNAVDNDERGYVVDYIQIIPVNTGAIKELTKRNKELEELVKALAQKQKDDINNMDTSVSLSFLLLLAITIVLFFIKY